MFVFLYRDLKAKSAYILSLYKHSNAFTMKYTCIRYGNQTLKTKSPQPQIDTKCYQIRITLNKQTEKESQDDYSNVEKANPQQKRKKKNTTKIKR